MIMIILRNKSIFWISFSLQAAFVVSNDSRESAKIKLRNIFGYDFRKIPSYTAIYVWKIIGDDKKYKPEDYSKGFRSFKSSETYFIFAKKWAYFIHLYYWAGKETSPKEKKTVAKYAMIFHHFFHQVRDFSYYVYFSREYETLETMSFQHILHELKGTTLQEHRSPAYCHKHLPLNGHNLYMVKGRETTRVKKVTFNLRWIKTNICLIIDTSGDLLEFYPTMVWCGKETNEKVHRRALEFGKNFSTSKVVDVITGCIGSKFKILIELLENNRNNRPSDVDTSSDDKIDDDEFIKNRDASVTLFKLLKNYSHGGNEVEQKPICLDIFYNSWGNFLFDSNSIAGLSCLFRYETSLEIKIWAIQYAEDYLHNKIKILGHPVPMRIMSTSPDDFQFDFMINVIDLPFSTLPNGDLEIW